MPMFSSNRRNDIPALEYDMNPYESFMKKHLQHYGYYTGRNASFRQSYQNFADWDQVTSFGAEVSDSDSESDDLKNSRSDSHRERDDTRTTQLIYSFKEGKMVPRLREPRQLYAINNKELGPQQTARWPSEIEVLPGRVKHISNGSNGEPEPFYKRTGEEHTPWIKGEDNGGEVVYEYEPRNTPFFMRSRVGGYRGEDLRAYIYELSDPNDPTLIFESRFESGNLAKVIKVGPYSYELWLRPDYYTGKHTQWYYFRVTNTRANVTYRFTIVNFMKSDSLYNHGMRPLMYSDKNAAQKKLGWVRCGSEIAYYKCNMRYVSGKSERCHYALTWTCQFPYNNDTTYFAHCYPYTYTDLQDYLLNITNDPIKSRICKQRMLCRTLAGNLVYVLTITSPTNDSEQNKMKKGVVLTSRVHPGETNASLMMKGFLDFLTGTSADAKLLRDTFVFKIVPMLNPDGVVVGNYRCSLAGRDLNRNYKTVLKESFPSVWHTKNMIRRLKEEREIVVYCDLHGHSRKRNIFIYGCENRFRPERRLRERIFPVMLSRNASDKFSFDACKFKVQKSKEGTGRIVMWNMGIMNSYTMEATFSGSNLGKKKGYHFSAADLESMGYDFCDTLLDYCDPDSTKERMKQEILQQMQKIGQTTVVSPSDIDLDDYYTSGLESSDGGSDSSVSDGLPVHLQYLAEQLPKKKKRLKSKKERDKERTPSKKTTQATAIQEGIPFEGKTSDRPGTAHQKSHESHKMHGLHIFGRKDFYNRLKSASPTGHIRYTTVRPKSRDDRTNGGIPIFTQERSDERAVKKSDYLEAITNAYLQNGVLRADDLQQQDVPHLRYSSRQGQQSPLPEGPCESHQKAFAASYVANTLGLKDGDDFDKWQAKSSRGQSRSAGSAILNNPVIQKHILEIAAAQQRHEEQKRHNSSGSSTRSRKDVCPTTPKDKENPPVSKALKADEIRPANQTSLLVEGNQSGNNLESHDKGYKPIFLSNDKSSSVQENVSNRISAGLITGSDLFENTSTTAERHPAYQEISPNEPLGHEDQSHHRLVNSAKYNQAIAEARSLVHRSSIHGIPSSNSRPLGSAKVPLDPATDLRMSLVNSAKKANLSPTTGKYIDRIMKQPEGEGVSIAAEIQHKMDQEKIITSNFVEERREFSQKTDGFASLIILHNKSDKTNSTYSKKLQEVGKEQHNNRIHDINNANSTENGLQYETGETIQTLAEYGTQGRGIVRSENNNNAIRNNTDIHRNIASDTGNQERDIDLDRLVCGNGTWPDGPDLDLDNQEVIDHFHRESSAGSGSSRELRRPQKTQNKIQSSSHQTVTLSSRSYESRNTNQSNKRNNKVAAPTKISLMIARGQRGIQNHYMGSTFRPLGKTPKPPLFRNTSSGGTAKSKKK